MFPWVFRATVLTHWTSRQNPTAAGEIRPLCWREPTQQELPSLHSLWAAAVCYCGTAKCQCCHGLQTWMNIESSWLIRWLLKQNRDPTWYDMYPIMVQFPIPCDFKPHGMINIPTYIYIWSCYAEQPVLIVIWKYMCMLWLLSFWAKDSVSA